MSRPKATVKCENVVRQDIFREDSVTESDKVSVGLVGLPSDITPEIVFNVALRLEAYD